MASKSLRRYDVQAKVGLIVSIVAMVGVVGMIAVLVRNYSADLQAILIGKGSLILPAYLLVAAGTMLLGAVGVALGFNSAGQRRNEMQRRSWAAFFIGGLACSAAMICLAVFWMNKISI